MGCCASSEDLDGTTDLKTVSGSSKRKAKKGKKGAVVDAVNKALSDESDEECAHCPGSPTGRQGSDLMAAKRRMQLTPATGDEEMHI